ncbi:MAG: hypothetical protein M9936_23190 [Caldilinea sp.]|nr:hypothetical protein [Caldilinea sp.]
MTTAPRRTTSRWPQNATVRCIFTDTKLSGIVVIKTTTGGDGSFAFTGSLGSFGTGTVSGTAQRLFANVLGGSYRISETVPAGWRGGCRLHRRQQPGRHHALARRDGELPSPT